MESKTTVKYLNSTTGNKQVLDKML